MADVVATIVERFSMLMSVDIEAAAIIPNKLIHYICYSWTIRHSSLTDQHAQKCGVGGKDWAGSVVTNSIAGHAKGMHPEISI